MKKGDLVRVCYTEQGDGQHNGLVGIIVEYFPQDESLSYAVGIPLHEAICVVLIQGVHAFFYESELTVLNNEKE